MKKILDWYEGNVVTIMRIGEDVAKEINEPTNFKEIKELILEELNMEETPEILENKIEGLIKEGLITITGNTYKTEEI